jgi:magnesium transporter
MGGNAATQTLAVIVRGLALGEVTWDNGKRVLLKETLVGLANGLVNGCGCGDRSSLVRVHIQVLMIGAIIAAAMVINLVIAGIAGTLIPLASRG